MQNNSNIMESSVNLPPFRRIDESTNNGSSDKHDYEEGIVRGFAIQHPAPSGFVLPHNHAINDLNYDIQQLADNKAG